MANRTFVLYGDTGSGKTTLAGELAKEGFKQNRTRTTLHSADMGGFESIKPLINVGVIEVDTPTRDADPWMWINKAVSTPPPPDVGLIVFDSGTSMGEGLLAFIAKSDMKVGAQNTQKFTVSKGKESLTVGANNMNHYGVVQTFMLDMIWKSTWLAQGGVDVLWTFSTDRGENTLDQPLVGPKLAGHALTSAIPKWFNYTFRVASIPVVDSPPRHVLYLQEQAEQNGAVMGFGNARYSLDASTPLPLSVEPASLVEALRLIEGGAEEAESNLRLELGL